MSLQEMVKELQIVSLQWAEEMVKVMVEKVRFISLEMVKVKMEEKVRFISLQLVEEMVKVEQVQFAFLKLGICW